jgi:hypothetical protein
MWRPIILASVGFVLAFAVKGQVKKQFSVENKQECKNVALTLKAKTGNCFIRPSPSHNQDILNIYSNQNLEEYDHTFSNEVIDNTCAIKLTLEPEKMTGVSHRISYKVFGADERASASDKFWKVYLTENTPYSLDLDYGLGNANIDLSGLSIEKLKIKTASADVNIGYNSSMENKITMDTFSVKVDMGSLNARQLNLAKTKILIAEVGFGNMTLDFGNKPKVANHIIGSVGAGNLIIQLPDEDIPVIVTINDSWLCSIQMARSLKKIGPNKYANAAYSQSSTDALRFDLDVSMGKIVFRDKN